MDRYQRLPERQRGLVLLALLANALVTLIVKAALAAAGISAARRILEARDLGARRALRAGWSPALAAAAAASLAHWAVRAGAIRAAQTGSGRQLLERADGWLTAKAQEHDAGPTGPTQLTGPTQSV